MVKIKYFLLALFRMPRLKLIAKNDSTLIVSRELQDNLSLVLGF